MVPNDPARSMAAKEAAAAWITSKRGPLGPHKKQEDDDHDEDDESGEHEFQKATEAMCIDGGASLHTSHRQLKQWAREITAVEPSFDARKPLK